MKQFKKDNFNNFVCEECNNSLKSIIALNWHIQKYHNKKNYYDKWLKENDNEEFCLYCQKELDFENFSGGYGKYCCKEHAKLYSYKKRKDTLNIKYGVTSAFQVNNQKENFLKKYNVDNPSKLLLIKAKKKTTCLKNHGVEAGFLLPKTKQTCLSKYGVEHPLQNKEIFNKALKTKRLIHQFKNTNLTYQGSYELDFLEKYHDKLDIKNGPSIKYKFKDTNKVYYSDFYIPSKNLIVEIKSTYILTLDEGINEKKKECLNQGFNYIMILDKNYDNFLNSFINSLL